MLARLSNLVGALAVGLSDEIFASVAAASGRTVTSTVALAALVGEPGLTISDLTVVLGLTPSGVVRVVDALVNDGLARRRGGRDARTVTVHLTPEGERLGRAALDRRQAVLAPILAGLSDDEQRVLTSAAERMLRVITPDVTRSEYVCRLCDLDACPQDRCPADPERRP